MPATDQKKLNEFLNVFYIFEAQKTAEQLYQYCTKMIGPAGETFGHAGLADTFAHYVHRWFNAEYPEQPVFNREIVKDFFDNQELYHWNLVKYSDVNYPEKQVNYLLDKYKKQLNELSCLKRYHDSALKPKEHVIIRCFNPSLASSIIKQLYPIGKRQVLTTLSTNLNEYKLSNKVEWVIIVGEENELGNLLPTLKKGKTKIIQILQTQYSEKSDLEINPSELNFLEAEFPFVSFFKDSNACVTDLLLFAVSKLTGGLSEDELAKYEEQELRVLETVLPLDYLESATKQLNNAELEKSWKRKDVGEGFEKVVAIQLPEELIQKSITIQNNRFSLKNNYLYYKLDEKPFYPPVPYSPKVTEIDFNQESHAINKWVNEKERFNKDCPVVMRIVSIRLANEYNEKLPNSWGISKDKKTVFYYPNGKPKVFSIPWERLCSNKTISIIEAEPGCGKTSYLRLIARNVIEDRFPILMQIRDIDKVKDFSNPVPELIDLSLLPPYFCRLAKAHSQHFHILWDGFDELDKKHNARFEEIISKLCSHQYSVTITVRNYQNQELQRHIKAIILQKKLYKFTPEKVKNCFLKQLHGIPVKENVKLEDEVEKLCNFLKNQPSTSEWLGVPLHVTRISEWYMENRHKEVPSISEILNFIIRNRIKKHSQKDIADVYKILYRIAFRQIFGLQSPALKMLFKEKENKFKQSLIFNLARTGLLKNPNSENPDLSHRTFAEFIVAKKLVRKIISASCKNIGFNLDLMRLLFQSENQVILKLFTELFTMQNEDEDIPYQLSDSIQHEFRNDWLLDICGRSLHANERSILIIQDEPPKLSATNKVEEEQIDHTNSVHFARGYMNYLKDKNCKSMPTENFSGFQELVKNKEIPFTFLLDELSDSKISDERFQIISKLIGLYIQVYSNERNAIFNLSWKYLHDKVNFLFTKKQLVWWRIDDLIAFTVFVAKQTNKRLVRQTLLDNFLDTPLNDISFQASTLTISDDLKQLEPQSVKDEKDNARKFIMLCLTIYQSTPEGDVKKNLYYYIHVVNYKLFLRNDYPNPNSSLYAKYHQVDAFDIEAIINAYNDMKNISKQYNWRHNNNSHAFQCWSDDGYKDEDFSKRIMPFMGPHLNIIHVLYLLLYIQYGGYSFSDKEQFQNLIMDYFEKLENENNVKVLFCSIILFTSILWRWQKSKQHPELAQIFILNFLRTYEKILKSEEANQNVKHFVHILFVNMMILFDLRGFTQFSLDGKLSLTIFNPREFTKTISLYGVDLGYISRDNYKKIYNALVKTAETEQEFDSFEKILTVWRELKKELDLAIVLEQSDETPSNPPLTPKLVLLQENAPSLLALVKNKDKHETLSIESPTKQSKKV